MSIYFNTLPEFTAHLDNLGLFRMSPGIGRIAVTLESMALKRSSMPLVQVVGTNGKGSTCTFLASLAKEHGVTCGLHSSPHFV
ncbi:bifunctional folylpolyglutamate synthase/dihydrofolate synthase, partial [Desulfovibrio sp. OttesenSCG-928-F07]|nr:bifunctional folylpolyglutamate synthase/dihydrofolate synthase [Desulfovibrio sp. OttesenSCG-928-F07]